MFNQGGLKKWMPVLLAFAMLLSGFAPTISKNGTYGVTEGVAQAAASVNIGDYIQFGKYYDAPILWRVIHKDPATGDPILLADRVLTRKAFDYRGMYHSGSGDLNRPNTGSNLYKDSNLRQWLNSSSPNSGANIIDWIQNDPSEQNFADGWNHYSTEKGFLADGNFTATERSLIKPYTHKVLLHESDLQFILKDGGTEQHTYNTEVANFVQNYDSAYFKNMTDSVFLLSVKQLKEWVIDNSTLGSTYYLAKPTPEAVAQSTYTAPNFTSSNNCSYWLNTPSTTSYELRAISSGFVGKQMATGSMCVRPAMQLNLSDAFITSGAGTSGSPYTVSDVPSEFEPPTVPGNLVASNVSVSDVTLTWSASTDNVAMKAYEIYSSESTTPIATISGSGGNPPATTVNLTGLSQGTSYSLTVKARDAANNRSDASNAVSFTTKWGPTMPALSTTYVAENLPANTVVGTLTSTDADSSIPVSFSLVSGSGSSDNASFNLSGTSLRTSASFDRESKSSYSIRVRATDSDGFQSEQSFAITVSNVNEAPTLAAVPTITVSESTPPSTTIATLTGTDPDEGEVLSYSLVSGSGDTDNSFFQLFGNKLQPARTLDYETKSTYSIRLRVTDSGGLTNEKTATINVTDVTAEYLLSSNVGKTTFTAAASEVDSSLTIPTNLSGITSSTNINGATVLIENPKVGDLLTYTGTLPSGVTAVAYNSTTGLLRFNGQTTQANWQALMRTVKFTMSSTDFESRVVHFSIGNAIPLANPDGSLNYYEVVNTRTGWNAAKTGAEALKAANVLSGYLATLQTKAQYDFLQTQFNVNGWIGGTDEFATINTATGKTTTTGFADQPASEGKFHWVTGPANERVQFSQGNYPNNTVLPGFYAKWNTSASEPDNAGGENFIVLTTNGMEDRVQSTNLNSNNPPNYFVEYSGGTTSLTASTVIEKTYTVTFATNGGSVVADQGVSHGNSVQPPTAPSRTGYQFGGWYANSAFTGNAYAFSTPVTAAITLYAKWNAIPTDIIVGKPNVTLQVGDYIQFGKYNDAQILWRVINKNSTTGDPILLADRILTIKAIDAKGSYHAGNSIRVSEGSNFYKDSNIRQWLNSSSPNSGSNTIDWIQNDPTAANMRNGFNPYSTEKGFLADGNFTTAERNWIKPLMHTVLLAGVDQAKKDGGTKNHTLNLTLSTVVQNYDTDAYYQNVSDLVFLLSVKQFKEWVYDNAGSLGSNYYQAKPTPQAVLQSTYKPTTLNSDKNFSYWLNTPLAEDSAMVRYVHTDGYVSSASSNVDFLGVRPALQLNLSSGFSLSGNGSSATPYVPFGSDTVSVAENNAVGAAVATLGAVDADSTSSATLTLVSGTGAADNASFAIDGNTLKAQVAFDFETKSSYSIRVRATDSDGASFEKVIIVNVTNVNEPPTDISLSNSSVEENKSLNTVVGSFSTTDPDAAGSANYSLVSGTGSTDNTSFNISGTNLRTSASFDFEAKSSYSVRVRVTDGGGLNYEKVFAIYVTDVNEAPIDNVAPTSPTGLASSNVTATSATVSWTASTDNVGVTGYEVYAGATLVGTTTGATTLNVNGLASGTVNSITIVAVDAAGNKSNASSVLTLTLTDLLAPSVPSGLTSSTITQSGFTVTWTASTDNRAVRSYNVYRNGTFVANVSTNRYTFSGLTTLTTYNITVLAIDTSSNRSAQSSALILTTTAPADVSVPSTPSGLTTTSVSDNRILISWTPSTDNVGILGYNVYVNNVYVKTVTAAQTDLTGLTQLTTYSIQVQALDAMKNRSARSTALSVTTLDGLAPSVPAGLASSSITKTGFTVNWMAATDNVGVKNYNVYRNGSYVTTVGATTTSYTFSGLPFNQTHSVRIMAIDAVGNRSAQSTALSVATLIATDFSAPTAPTNLASSNVSKTGFRVTWTAATDNVAVTNYNIYRNGAYVATVSGTTTAYNFSGLTADTSYSIIVRALDAEKNFTNSTVFSVTTLP